jgi:hypothetical protein
MTDHYDVPPNNFQNVSEEMIDHVDVRQDQFRLVCVGGSVTVASNLATKENDVATRNTGLTLYMEAHHVSR